MIVAVLFDFCPKVFCGSLSPFESLITRIFISSKENRLRPTDFGFGEIHLVGDRRAHLPRLHRKSCPCTSQFTLLVRFMFFLRFRIESSSQRQGNKSRNGDFQIHFHAQIQSKANQLYVSASLLPAPEASKSLKSCLGDHLKHSK
jgi:hypothetical protein